jgi:hypothetical protein
MDHPHEAGDDNAWGSAKSPASRLRRNDEEKSGRNAPGAQRRKRDRAPEPMRGATHGCAEHQQNIKN